MYLSTVVYLYFCCLVYNHKIRGKLHAKVVKRSQITCNRWGIHKSQIVLEKGMYMGGRGGGREISYRCVVEVCEIVDATRFSPLFQSGNSCPDLLNLVKLF